MTSWTTFVCDKPDFTVRSAVDGSLFPTSKAALGKSEVFRDMFTCCDPLSTEGEDSLELHETSGELTALLRLLHEPPPNPSELAQDDLFRPISYDPKTVVPLPILIPVLFPLADKYAIEESVVEGLKKHLAANAPQHPLEVYGFASANGMEWEASTASQFVQPLASYSLAQVTRTILSVPAYHRLHKLQDNRVKELHRLLLQEEIFPNGASV